MSGSFMVIFFLRTATSAVGCRGQAGGRRHAQWTTFRTAGFAILTVRTGARPILEMAPSKQSMTPSVPVAALCGCFLSGRKWAARHHFLRLTDQGGGGGLTINSGTFSRRRSDEIPFALVAAGDALQLSTGEASADGTSTIAKSETDSDRCIARLPRRQLSVERRRELAICDESPVPARDRA